MKEADIEKNLRGAIQAHEAARLKSRLQALETRKKRPFFHPRNILLLAAAVALLLTVGYLLRPQQAPSGPALFAQYHESYPNVLAPVRRGTAEPSLKMRAFEAYESGKYGKAAGLFEAFLTTKDEPEIRFYHALSLLEANEDSAALATFMAIEGVEMRFSAEVLWYQALLELKLGHKPQAVESLERLQKMPSPYQARAGELLKKL